MDTNGTIKSAYSLLIPDPFSVWKKKSKPTEVFSVNANIVSESEHRVAVALIT